MSRSQIEQNNTGSFSLKALIDKVRHMPLFHHDEKIHTPKNLISSAAFAEKLLQKTPVKNQRQYKLVILGSAGSGKTTTMRSIGSLEASETKQEGGKEHIVGIDYGKIALSDDLKVNLIGYSGRVQFNFMWEATAKDADAFLILLDLAHENPLAELDFFLKMLRIKYGYKNSIYCALTHSDHSKHDIEKTKKKVVKRAGKNTELYLYDPRSKLQSLKVITDIGHAITRNKARRKPKAC